jgi:hypothetical protein
MFLFGLCSGWHRWVADVNKASGRQTAACSEAMPANFSAQLVVGWVGFMAEDNAQTAKKIKGPMAL